MKTKESNSLFSGVLLPVNLLMRILVFLLPAVLLCGCSSSDDGSGDGGNPVPEYDRSLVGTWQISDNGGDQSAPGTLVLEADGKGTYDGGTLKWYTSERKLYVSFDNGRRIKGDLYYVDGAELTIQGSNLVYTTSFPAVGRWYAEDFKGGFFSYDFSDTGVCKTYGFDDGGNQVKRDLWWFRIPQGVVLDYDGYTRTLQFDLDGDRMIVEGEGTFVRDVPVYGNWRSVYTENGPIGQDSEDYSELEIIKKEYGSFFYCTYHSDECIGSGPCTMTVSCVMELFPDGGQMYIRNDDSVNIVIYYRFHYDKTAEKLYLELSKEVGFNKYSGYEMVE